VYILLGTEQRLRASQVAGARVDQCCLGPAQGVCREQFWIKPNACHPIREKTSVLARRHGSATAAPAVEKIFASLLAVGFQKVVNGLTSLVAHLELYRPAGLPLPHTRAIECVANGCNIFEP